MQPSRRAFVAGTALAFALPACAFGQEKFPTRPVKFIVPYPPGQSADLVPRLVADELGKIWGQGVVVDNRAGGASIPGMQAGKEAAPDGYTLTIGTVGSIAINAALYPKLPYDPVRDFEYVNSVFSVPLVFVAHPASGISSMDDLVARARATSTKLQWGIAGAAGAQHLASEQFNERAGIQVEPAIYKGSGPMLQDVLGAQITLAVDSVPSALPFIRSGKLRALAVTSSKRVPQLPDVPTVAELGYPGYESVGWAGVMAPRGTPRALVDKLSKDIRRALESPALIAKVTEMGAVVDARDGQKWTEFVKSEMTSVRDIVKKSGITVN
jgi:tripartite-type tricarboxylate transporter receptor subunit TctC